MSRRKLIRKSLFCAAAALLAGLLTTQPAMASAATLQGIDVSSWQPGWVTSSAQADFAIVKATQGTSYTSPTLYSQASGALATGKKLGLYHYAAGGSCVAEADFFLRTIRPWLRRAVLVLDWESYQNKSWGNPNWSTCFVRRVKQNTGVTPLVYVSASALWQVQGARQSGSGLWLARYATMAPTGYQNSPWKLGEAGEAMLQYSSNGRIPGYSGPLDLNAFLGSREQWDRYANPSSQPVSNPTPVPTPNPAHDPSPQPSPQASGEVCVVVQAGDSLSSIAARHGGVWSDYTGYRSGKPSVIYPGETVCRQGAPAQSPAQRPQQATSSSTVYHVVVSGETLSSIAARYGTSWQSLQAANGLRNPNRIYPGQRLVIRRGYSTGARSHSSYSYNYSSHVVMRGETLSGIAARHGTSWQQLAAKNRLANPNRIYPGQRLLL